MANTSENQLDEHLKEFERVLPVHSEFTKRISDLLSRLISDSSIKVHAIEQRTKNQESFREKLLRPGKNYSKPMTQITDLSGVRIILYYQEDVQRVIEMIESEFITDKEASGDQAAKLEPNEFGYRSVHYVVSLTTERSKLKEWKPYSELKSEIQIRTVLQHAWAAISHTLHYKHEQEVPAPLSRKLFRLSGLLELADEEFSSLNQEIKGFTAQVSKKFEAGIPDIAIDATSISQYLERSDLPEKYKQIAIKAGFNFSLRRDVSEKFSNLTWYCSTAGLTTIRQLDNLLRRDFDMAERFLKLLIVRNENEWSANEIFILELIILLNFWGKFSVRLLDYEGWDENVAERVLVAARDINQNQT